MWPINQTIFQNDGNKIYLTMIATFIEWLSSALFVSQLQTLIQSADPGADYRIDRALNEACESVIQTACKHIRNGDPMWVVQISFTAVTIVPVHKG